jgi:hypothetical protein
MANYLDLLASRMTKYPSSQSDLQPLEGKNFIGMQGRDASLALNAFSDLQKARLLQALQSSYLSGGGVNRNQNPIEKFGLGTSGALAQGDNGPDYQ